MFKGHLTNLSTFLYNVYAIFRSLFCPCLSPRIFVVPPLQILLYYFILQILLKYYTLQIFHSIPSSYVAAHCTKKNSN